MDEVLQDRTTLRADASSARAARRFLRDVLEDWRCDEVVEVVLLAANELVTNAILHARTDFELIVRLARGVVRIEVIDFDERLPVHRDARDDALGGRGMGVLNAVADRWGVDPVLGGKKVWFEVPA
ncbi:MAG TPA: ATP-binding protein [Acidimicrobiales bacterium]|nr:ATP-binding protein [Acidimicrobiales bacterium]